MLDNPLTDEAEATETNVGLQMYTENTNWGNVYVKNEVLRKMEKLMTFLWDILKKEILKNLTHTGAIEAKKDMENPSFCKWVANKCMGYIAKNTDLMESCKVK